MMYHEAMRFLQKNIVKIILIVFVILISIGIYLCIFTKGFNYLTGFIYGNEKPLCKDCNVLLVTLDTCAANDMPCYGYDRNTTPNFCQFAKNNIFFQNAYANAPWTLPSHASIFTGLYPSEHGINRPYLDRLPSNIPLLSDVLNQNGYETLFFMNVLPDMAVPFDRIYGRGASKIEETTDINTVLDTFIKNVGEGKKTFASFHTYACHYPYFIGDEKKMFTTDSLSSVPLQREEVYYPFTEGFYTYLLETMPKSIESNEFFEKTDALQYVYLKLKSASNFEEAKHVYKEALQSIGETELFLHEYYTAYYFFNDVDVGDQRKMTYLRALYDQILFNLDTSVIAKLQQAFTTTQLKDNTILIITSDHGAEFGEHGVFGHYTLYDQNIKIPFMMVVPQTKPREIKDTIQTVDIMPTVLDLVGIKNNYFFNGVSLVNLLKGKPIQNRVLVSQSSVLEDPSNKKRIIRDGEWKVFVLLEGDKIIPYELYNTMSDASEQHNVLPEHFDIAEKLIFEYKKIEEINNQKRSQ